MPDTQDGPFQGPHFDSEKGLHANRPFSIPTDDGPANCFSRSDILTGETPAAFGSDQSLKVCSDGESPDDFTTWPKRWYARGRVLRMPKTVVLSSFPYWTMYWPSCYFFMPRDVIGDTGFGGLGNYYYLDQWNGLDPTITEADPDYSFAFDSGLDLSDPAVEGALASSDGYANNRAWKDMVNLDPAQKHDVYNMRQSCLDVCMDQDCQTCTQIPQYLINKCPVPPQQERYFQGVGSVQNPYYQIHPQLLQAFQQAKVQLESDPTDPIYVTIPDWMPPKLYQLRNAFLMQSHEKENRAHGGAVNFAPCNVADINPCYSYANVCWAPPYPDVGDPRNQPGFPGVPVPWLSNCRPGVGTNSLHLYVGHANIGYDRPTVFTDYQAWPLTPEVQYLAGPIYTGSYLGDPLPYFAGRRTVWRASGFDYGYAVHGADGLYDNVYGSIIEGAARDYKANSWRFRDLGTRLFTYQPQWNFSWDFQKLYGDRRNDCPATQFYFGFDFVDYAAGYDTEDSHIDDCAGMTNGLKVGETKNYFPSKASIDEAIGIGTRLSQRVMDYYNSVDPGTGDFFQLAIDRNNLADYNVSYEGGLPGDLMDPDGIVSYVRDYFKDHR
jgi:hypothetical protein